MAAPSRCSACGEHADVCLVSNRFVTRTSTSAMICIACAQGMGRFIESALARASSGGDGGGASSG